MWFDLFWRSSLNIRPILFPLACNDDKPYNCHDEKWKKEITILCWFHVSFHRVHWVCSWELVEGQLEATLWLNQGLMLSNNNTNKHLQIEVSFGVTQWGPLHMNDSSFSYLASSDEGPIAHVGTPFVLINLVIYSFIFQRCTLCHVSISPIDLEREKKATLDAQVS